MNKFNTSYIGLRKDLLKYISGKNLCILDVGCATGVNGQWLKENKGVNFVAGIELDAKMAEKANRIYDKTIVGNLEELEFPSLFSDYKFDYILLGDILEHLNNPWDVLKKLTHLLQPNGIVIISLPNIQHINTFYNLYIRGEWAYNERGIYDKTHLRWFTLKNIRNLIKYSNLHIVKLERKYRFRDALGSKFPLGTKLILTQLFKNLFTFQYVIVCTLE